ncbi:MAG: hypothetical protein ROR55_20895 [Devosia sp.]
MKKLILVSALSLGLSGCITAADFVSDYDKIAAGLKKNCRFVATATSILAILNLPGAPLADEIVEGLCKELEKLPAAERSRRGQTVEFEAFDVMVTGSRI